MKNPEQIMELLACTGAASSSQIRQWSGNRITEVVSKLEAGQLMVQVARARLAASGRPQAIWSLTALGSRRAGLYFSPSFGRDAIIKGLLKTEFMLTRPEGVYPLFFANQVSEFEKGGEPWPWQGKEEPLRVSALLCVLKNTRHVGLAITTPREARQWLEPSKLNWAKRPGYRLTLLLTEEGANFIQDILNPMTDFNDPFYQKQKTYQEWRAILRGLAPEKERYRHHIERVLRWIELDGEQESAERYDLVMRAFPEPGYQPEIMKRVIGPVQLLGNGG